MSVVTNVIITGPVDWSGEYTRALQQWFDTKRPGELAPQPVNTNDTGGGKQLECAIWIGAHNFLSDEALSECVQYVDWEHPENVRVFVQRQDDDAFEPLDWSRGTEGVDG